MKIDFEYLNRVANALHKASVEDGDVSQQLDKGSMVYSINLDPAIGQCSVHVQWPYFRNLVANEGDHPASYTRVQQSSADEPWIHWQCDVTGVQIRACMCKSDILRELESLEDGPLNDPFEDEDIEDLLALWMNATGWNMPCP